ncbi:MAG TPA: hypothetical protein VM368_06395 [Flavisolibacter sp.]|nr:hypothetical protein [Flavisolibacter sp.]
MKKKIFGLFVLLVAFGFIACTNSGDATAATDTTTTTTTTTDMGSYAAKAETLRTESEAGNYLDPRTGKQLRLQMDASTGRVTNVETGEPVWRYVDRRNWWVYGGDNWDRIGEARMDGDRLMYKDDSNNWVDYDARWKTEDTRLQEEYKMKYGDTKIKVDKDGDVKVKDEKGKVKYDADDKRIKVDSSR